MKKTKLLIIPCIAIGVSLLMTGCDTPKDVVIEDTVLVTDVDFEPSDTDIDLSILENENNRNMQTEDEDYEVDLLYKGIEKEFNSKDLFNECVDKIGKKVKLKMNVTMMGNDVIDYDIQDVIKEEVNNGK